jgi:hypothetical protein
MAEHVAIRFQRVHEAASSCKRSSKARSTRRSAARASQPRPTMHSEDTAKVINHRHGHCWRGTDRATHSRRHRGGRPGCDRDLSTSRDLLVLIGAPTDGQKVLLAVKAMGGESAPRPGARWSMISSGPAWGNPVPRRQSRVQSRARVGRLPVQRCNRAQAAQPAGAAPERLSWT